MSGEVERRDGRRVRPWMVVCSVLGLLVVSGAVWVWSVVQSVHAEIRLTEELRGMGLEVYHWNGDGVRSFIWMVFGSSGDDAESSEYPFIQEVVVRGELSREVYEVLRDKVSTLQELMGLRIFDGTGARGEGFEWIGRMGWLGAVDFSGNQAVTDADIQALTPLRFLRFVGLDGTNVTDEGVASLAEHSWLVAVSLKDTEVTDAGVAALARAPMLGRVNLMGTKITARSLELLSQSPKVDVVEVSNTALGGRGFEHLAKTGRMRMLAAANCGLNSESIRAISEMRALTALDVSHSALSGEDIELILSLPRLDRLNLKGVVLSRDSLVRLGNAKNIKELSVADSPLDDVGVLILSGIPSLDRLDLSGTKITDASVEYLVDLKEVELDIRRTGITQAGRDALREAGVKYEDGEEKAKE